MKEARGLRVGTPLPAPISPPHTTVFAAAPTWLVVGAVYLGWLSLTLAYHAMPWWLVLPLGGWLVAWHNSLQHEAVHGHLSRKTALNAALAWPPLGLWMPYALYRDSHLEHHRTPQLTEPMADPESYYVTHRRWTAMSRPGRALLITNNALAGRMLIGPWLVIGRFWAGEARRLLRGDFRHARAWLLHVALCTLLLTWVRFVCGIPIPEYLLLFAWPGLSLTLLRSFAEHRPAQAQGQRSAIVAAGPLMRLLYLNNNLHALHHARPDLPWHGLPAAYRRDSAEILRDNGGYLFAGGYLEIARRFAFRPKDRPVHSDPTLGSHELR